MRKLLEVLFRRICIEQLVFGIQTSNDCPINILDTSGQRFTLCSHGAGNDYQCNKPTIFHHMYDVRRRFDGVRVFALSVFYVGIDKDTTVIRISKNQIQIGEVTLYFEEDLYPNISQDEVNEWHKQQDKALDS